MRWFYALAQMWRHQSDFVRVHQEKKVTCLTVDWLRTHQIQILVLDFDGVLAPHAAPSMLPEVQGWLQHLIVQWPEGKICILSNKSFAARVQWVAIHYPSITFLTALKPKPYPDTLLSLQASQGLLAEQILIVDDRLLTGVLAGLLAQTQVCWVTQPWQDYKARPVAEFFFAFLRFWEKILLQAKL